MGSLSSVGSGPAGWKGPEGSKGSKAAIVKQIGKLEGGTAVRWGY